MFRPALAFGRSLLCLVLTTTTRAAEPATRPAPPADAKLAIFLLAGQSNMAGRGKVEPQDQVADPNVWALDAQNAWVPAIDPLHFDKPKIAGVGLGRTFAIDYAKAHPDTIVGLVPCAVGGTSLDEWAPGGKLYSNAIDRMRIAMRHGTVRGILWHQGESDAKPERIESYATRFDALIAHFRADLQATEVPLVVGQLGILERAEESTPRVPFNAMIARYPEGRPLVACVTSEGLKSNGDGTHFDAASQRELGRRYAAAFLKLEAAAPAARP